MSELINDHLCHVFGIGGEHVTAAGALATDEGDGLARRVSVPRVNAAKRVAGI